jgi:hypothetical protein
MKRLTLTIVVATGAFLLCALPGYADRLRGGIAFEYGSSSSWFGLASPPFFSVPYQNNSSSDGILSGSLEYLVVRGWALEVGVAFKGSFALSGWNLGSPGVTDTLGYYYYPDDVHISADWWALAALVTAHVHVGPFATLDGAVGYGPFGYVNVTYWDDAGVVTGPVTQGSGVFPQNAWSIDWSAGLSFWFFGLLSLSLDVGMMGPDFVSGIGVNFRI